MLESSSCKRGNDLEGTLNETKERKSIIADTENVKSNFATERKYNMQQYRLKMFLIWWIKLQDILWYKLKYKLCMCL